MRRLGHTGTVRRARSHRAGAIPRPGRRLPQEILDAYDLVRFDPRGVARSTPVGCRLAPEDLSPMKLRSWPSADGDIVENAAFAERVADACAECGGPLLAELGTANEARDVDAIRAALGEVQREPVLETHNPLGVIVLSGCRRWITSA